MPSCRMFHEPMKQAKHLIPGVFAQVIVITVIDPLLLHNVQHSNGHEKVNRETGVSSRHTYLQLFLSIESKQKNRGVK